MSRLYTPGAAAGDAPALTLDQATPDRAASGPGTRDLEGDIQIWESERTRPPQTPLNAENQRAIDAAFERSFADCMRHPFLRPEQIRAGQFERIQELVKLAYEGVPVYRDKYRAAGFSPSDLRAWDDIQLIPTITKAELIAAFPDRCLHPRLAEGSYSRRARRGPRATPCSSAWTGTPW